MARSQAPPKRWAKEPSPSASSSDASVFRKTPGSSSVKIPVRGQRAEEPAEGVRVGVELLREIRDRARAAGERVRDAEVGDQCEGARSQRPAQEVPEQVLRIPGGHPRAARTAPATSSTSASESVRQSSRSVSSRAMPTTEGSPSRSGSASSSGSAHAKLGISATGSAPPPERATVSWTVPPVSSASRSARARTASAGSVEHAQDREVAAARAVGRQGALERGQRELVGPERALERMPAHALDEVAPPDGDAGLRAAEELVAREGDDVRARLEARARRGLVADLDERSRAEVVHEGEALPVREPGEVAGLRPLREPDHAEVRLVDAEQHRRALRDRALVVGEPRAVRRPHLDERRPGAGEHLGNAEAVADLDQLAA